MERFLLAAHPAAQHTNAFLSIGQQLRARGHEVAFLAFPNTRAHLRARGFTTFDSLVFPDAGRDGAPGRFWSLLPGHARDIARLAHQWGSSTLVADSLFPAAALGAEHAGLPWVTVYTDSLPFPGPLVPPPGSGLPIGEEWGWRGSLAQAKSALSHRQEEWALRAARAGLGLGRPEWPLASRVSPWLTLALTTEAIEAPRGALPETVFLVGPCRPAPEPAVESDHLLGQLRDDVPRVYISTSAAFDWHPPFFAKLIQGLASLRVQIILDVGAGLPDSRSAGMPPNVVALRGVSHPTVLPQVDAVVCDGSHELVTEALAQGKPLLVAPVNGPGADNAARIEFLGAGLRVDPRRTTRFELRGLVESLLKEGTCRSRADALGRSLAFTDGPGVAAGLIERLALTRAPVRRPVGCTASLFRDSPLPWERRDLLVIY